MLSAAIFQPAITTLESQIAQLQAQIAQAEQRIANLTEVEFIASNALAALQGAVEKIAALTTPGAITNLKTAVFALFSADDSDQLVEPLSGQYSDFASLLSDAPKVDDPFVELVQVNDAITYQLKQDGEIICTYAGFSNKAKAKQWGEWLAVHRTVASGFEVREAKRLTNVKHELKLWGLSINQIQRLAECDFSKDPHSPSNPNTVRLSSK